MLERSRHVAALLSALRFQDPQPELLRGLNDTDWDRLLAFADRAHLTLVFGRICRDFLPGWVAERIARNLADNTERIERIRLTYVEIAATLRAAGAEHLLLKGFTKWPQFVAEPSLRMQSDIDLYCPSSSVFLARDALLQIGYESERAPDHDRKDHLPALIRRDGSEWRGNVFDPELPPGVELHFRFWHRSQWRIGPRELKSFWARRTQRVLGTTCFPTLDPVDGFGYSALHALRDLIQGGLVPSHIYELAYFLHRNAGDEMFWKEWLAAHDRELRSLAVVSSLLAVEWFDCRLPEPVAAEIACLPGAVPRWYLKFADSPIEFLSRRNKDSVWLHLALINSRRDRLLVFLAHLFPLWIPRLDSRWVQEDQGSREPAARRPIFQFVRYLHWFVTRTLQHLRMILPALWHGLRLWAS